MSDRKPTEEEVYAECRKIDRDFPVGWKFTDAMALLAKTRRELEARPRLVVTH